MADLGTGLVLHSDDTILAVNKPSGLRTIPDGYNPGLPHLQGLLQSEYGRLWVVHRLDRDTSGVIIFARSAEAHRHLNLQFEHRQIHKIYHALVAGSPSWEQQRVELPLRVDGDRKHRTVVDHDLGKPAVSDVEVLSRFELAALLAVYPHTGYTHQIRAHLAAVGFPILYDPLYQSLSRSPIASLVPLDQSLTNPGRLALHAFQLRFLHPASGESIMLEAPYPQDFQDILSILKNNPS